MGRRHLNLSEREMLGRCFANGLSLRKAGKLLGCSAAALCKERKRNSIKGVYDANQANTKACLRRKNVAHHKKKFPSALEEYIFDRMRRCWSPEQVCGRLPIDFPDDPAMRISFKTVYRRIERGVAKGNKWRELYYFLRLKKKGKSMKNHASRNKGPAVLLPNIDLRPKIVDEKCRFGDWESDLICGPKGKGYIATFVERSTQFLLATECKQQNVADYNKAALNTLGRLAVGSVHTVTVDRGSEFYGYRHLEATLGTRYYFCHPRSPNERGLNEQTNGLLRQFFPKTKTLLGIDEELERAVTLLNHRPRKTLGYRSPAEMLEQVYGRC